VPVEPGRIAVEFRMFPRTHEADPPPLLPERVISLPVLAVDQASDRCYPASPAPNCVTTSILVQFPFFELLRLGLHHLERRDVVVVFDGWPSKPLEVLSVMVFPEVERRIETADSASFRDFAWNGRPVVDGADATGTLRSGQRAAFFARGLGRTIPPVPLGRMPDGPERVRPAASLVVRYTWLTEGTMHGAAASPPKSGIIEPDIHLVSAPPAGIPNAVGLYRVEFTVPPMPVDSASCSRVNRFYNLILIVAPDPERDLLLWPNTYRSDVAEVCVEPGRGQP
jgi:hypothetical protein